MSHVLSHRASLYHATYEAWFCICACVCLCVSVSVCVCQRPLRWKRENSSVQIFLSSSPCFLHVSLYMATAHLSRFFNLNSTVQLPACATHFLLSLTSLSLSLSLFIYIYFFRLLSFPLSSQQHLILLLVCQSHFPALHWQTVGGLLSTRGKFGQLSSRVPRGEIDWQSNLLLSVCSALLVLYLFQWPFRYLSIHSFHFKP